VNYAFMLTWLADGMWWRLSHATYISRSDVLTGTWRLFSLVMFANAAIAFARPAMRPLGVALVIALLWAWRPKNRAPKA
jgi:hypothetical protein